MAPVAETAQLPFLERLGFHEYNPPFVNGLVRSNLDVFVGKVDFENMVIAADRLTTTSYLDYMNRSVDTTGMIHSFIGRYQTPEEVQARLDSIAASIQGQLREEPEKLQTNVYKTLEATDFCDIDAFLWLDKKHGELAQQLNDLQTPEAKAFQQRNIATIDTLAKKEILYLPTYWQNLRLTGITQYMTVPQMSEENIQILKRITPVFFQRELNYEDQDPHTPVGFMQQFRKSGHPMARAMARFLKEQQNMNAYREKILSQA